MTTKAMRGGEKSANFAFRPVWKVRIYTPAGTAKSRLGLRKMTFPGSKMVIWTRPVAK